MSTGELSNKIPRESVSPFTVAAWNILLDRTHGDYVSPQDERIESHAKTLSGLGKTLDVVAISEAEKANNSHNGERLAELAGYGVGQWYRHSREAEHIGMFGAQLSETEPLNLGHKKKAIITKLGSVSVAGVHLKFQLRGDERSEQIAVLLEHLSEEEQSVIMGDFNSLSCQTPRRLIKAAGYWSVFEALGKRRPRTVPTAAYRPMLTPVRKYGSWPGFNVDDIYIKNLDVLDAGSFIGDSDHAGVWATVTTHCDK